MLNHPESDLDEVI